MENLVIEKEEQIQVQALQNQDYSDLLVEQEEIKSALEAEINEYKDYILQQEEIIKTQQDNISQLSQELEKIQQQTARLERECSLLQENYNEEQNKLKQIEAENKDLRIRLQRQQRYNLQYKTALDQFLDTSSISNRDSDGLGIKSWADNESKNDIANGSDDFDFNISHSKDLWHTQSSIDSKTESNTNDSLVTENGELNNSSLDPKPDESEIEPKKTKEEQQKNRNKLFIKLPQFGTKKDDEK